MQFPFFSLGGSGCLAVTLFITGAALQGINKGNGIMSTRNGFVVQHYQGTTAC